MEFIRGMLFIMLRERKLACQEDSSIEEQMSNSSRSNSSPISIFFYKNICLPHTRVTRVR